MRHSLRGLFTVALAAALVCLLPTVSSLPAYGVVGGTSDASTVPWSVRIQSSAGTCSGSLIAEQWVLTAAHCIHEGLKPSGKIASKTSFSLLLGAKDRGDSGGVKRGLAQEAFDLGFHGIGAGGRDSGPFVDDLALLKLDSPAPANLAPLPLNFPGSQVPPGSQIRFHGWGQTSPDGPFGEFQRSTRAGAWTIGNGACFSATRTACFNMASGGESSYPKDADSGAPVTAFVRGSYIQAGAFTGVGNVNGKVSTPKYGANLANYTSVIRSLTGLRGATPNSIVREPRYGTSWLIDGQGWRHWIATGAIYNCLVSNGVAVQSRARYDALSIPEDTGAHAQCTPRSSNPAPPAGRPKFTVMNTSETPPDGVWFRDSPNAAGPRLNGYGVYSGDRVELRCYGWGQNVGSYNNRLWYYSSNLTRPAAPGRANVGWLNAHYVNDGKRANEVTADVPPC